MAEKEIFVLYMWEHDAYIKKSRNEYGYVVVPRNRATEWKTRKAAQRFKDQHWARLGHYADVHSEAPVTNVRN